MNQAKLGVLLIIALGASVAWGVGRGSADEPPGIGSRVFVVERESEQLAVYDLDQRRVVGRIGDLGNLRHALMTFSPDLRYGFLATRNGKLTRIDLHALKTAGQVFTSDNSIDIAISQDGRYVATAEYAPGGVTLLDARSFAVVKKIPSPKSRVTGIVDAPGNRFVCVTMEGGEVWIIDASRPEMAIEHRIPVGGLPYDAMITPDGRWYVVGHQNADSVSVVDLLHPERGARKVSLRDPSEPEAADMPVKLPHLASWAVAGDHVFVPLVGRARLAVLDRDTWAYERSIPLRGHPVYAVRTPSEREVWVSFSGEADDAHVQIIDTERLEVTRTLEVGGRIYHLAFTPRGSHALITANRANELVLVNAATYEIEDREPLRSPSGVFGVWRAFTIGL